MRRLLLVLIFLFITACSTVKYVDLPSVHNDTLYIEKMRVDSIFTDRYHTLTTKGDTIWMTDSIYVYKFKQLRDTVNIFKVDTIYKPQIVEVERKPSVFDKLKDIWFWVLTIMSICFFFQLLKRLL